MALEKGKAILSNLESFLLGDLRLNQWYFTSKVALYMYLISKFLNKLSRVELNIIRSSRNTSIKTLYKLWQLSNASCLVVFS